ncbi:MAG: membrane protein insertion efficiency factor YidD [Gammaproteobacteria bacterium]
MSAQKMNIRALLAPRRIIGMLIRSYQYWISPLLGRHCRFWPSCSEYAREAIERYGLWRGGSLAAKRVCRCHLWHPGGCDPVP